jgi:hypothetical protein
VYAANINLSFSDLNLVHAQEFDLYKLDGSTSSYVGTYNTSETVIELDPAFTYHAILKPSKWSWLDDPIVAIDGGLRTAPPILSFFMLCIIVLLPASLLLRRH